MHLLDAAAAAAHVRGIELELETTIQMQQECKMHMRELKHSFRTRQTRLILVHFSGQHFAWLDFAA